MALLNPFGATVMRAPYKLCIEQTNAREDDERRYSKTKLNNGRHDGHAEVGLDLHTFLEPLMESKVRVVEFGVNVVSSM